jgi:pimeloyl-ACP methyl ester carboxylesterase
VCGAACDDLVRAVASTPFRSYWREGHYTLECDEPYPGAPVLVLLHGYGSGSGLWAFNLDDLASRFKVYAVDWRGCGASHRPAFTATTVAEGERFFTEGLEAWACATDAATGGSTRSAVWVGHSLGGYLAAAYALHHPHRMRECGHVRGKGGGSSNCAVSLEGPVHADRQPTTIPPPPPQGTWCWYRPLACRSHPAAMCWPASGRIGSCHSSRGRGSEASRRR